jgi:ribosome recycling factor
MTTDIATLTEETMAKMEDAAEALKKDFAAIRTGKASPALVEGIMVEYYGTSTRLRDIASITAPEPRLLVIQPWDQSAVKSVEKAIMTSDIGISPVSDGRVIRLPIPELSEERRKDMVKRVRTRAEDARIEIRNARRDAIEVARKAEKASDITEDDLHDTTKEIQDLTDQYVEEIDKLMAAKEEELMQV